MTTDHDDTGTINQHPATFRIQVNPRVVHRVSVNGFEGRVELCGKSGLYHWVITAKGSAEVFEERETWSPCYSEYQAWVELARRINGIANRGDFIHELRGYDWEGCDDCSLKFVRLFRNLELRLTGKPCEAGWRWRSECRSGAVVLGIRDNLKIADAIDDANEYIARLTAPEYLVGGVISVAITPFDMDDSGALNERISLPFDRVGRALVAVRDRLTSHTDDEKDIQSVRAGIDPIRAELALLIQGINNPGRALNRIPNALVGIAARAIRMLIETCPAYLESVNRHSKLPPLQWETDEQSGASWALDGPLGFQVTPENFERKKWALHVFPRPLRAGIDGIPGNAIYFEEAASAEAACEAAELWRAACNKYDGGFSVSVPSGPVTPAEPPVDAPEPAPVAHKLTAPPLTENPPRITADAFARATHGMSYAGCEMESIDGAVPQITREMLTGTETEYQVTVRGLRVLFTPMPEADSPGGWYLTEIWRGSELRFRHPYPALAEAIDAVNEYLLRAFQHGYA